MVLDTHIWAGRSDITPSEFYDYIVDPSTTISEPFAPGQGIGDHLLRMYAEISQEVHPELNYDRSYLNDSHKFINSDDPQG